MATNVPASLKTADISRFYNRAAQVERAKPVIAYWCNFWIVNQIIAKGLHNSDDESKEFTSKLMDKLEEFKNENPDNDAITDNVAGQAYVEQFGLEVLGRAENAMSANKVTAQTADTFQAAATFLELCQIWGQLDPDISSKIKFAKYHAVRIAKALKNGEDPNLSNPVREEKATTNDEPEALDPSDPEVQALQGSSGPVPTASSRTRQPSVEEVPDDTDRIQHRLAQQSILDESLHPSRTSSVPPAAAAAAPAPPELPSAPSNFTLPQPPPTLPDTPGSIGHSTIHSSAPHGSFQSFPPPASDQPPSSIQYPPQPPAPQIPPSMYPNPATIAPPALHHQLVAAAPGSTPANSVDDKLIAQAQKHARWAVSALNFDDVNTAIKELKNALRTLGAE